MFPSYGQSLFPQENEVLGFEEGDRLITICSLGRIPILDQRVDEGPVNVIEDHLDGIIGTELQGSLICGEGELISRSHRNLLPTG